MERLKKKSKTRAACLLLALCMVLTLLPITTFAADPALFILNTSVIGGHGTISEGKTAVLKDTEETIIFSPDPGYEIDVVTVNGVETSVLSNVLTLPMTEDKTVTVKYKAQGGGGTPAPDEILAVVNGTVVKYVHEGNTGTAELLGTEAIPTGIIRTYAIPGGASVSLEPDVSAGRTFAQWRLLGTVSPPIEFAPSEYIEEVTFTMPGGPVTVAAESAGQPGIFLLKVLQGTVTKYIYDNNTVNGVPVSIATDFIGDVERYYYIPEGAYVSLEPDIPVGEVFVEWGHIRPESQPSVQFNPKQDVEEVSITMPGKFTYLVAGSMPLIPGSDVVDSLDLSGITLPVAGETPDYEGILPEDAKYHFVTPEEFESLIYDSKDKNVNGIWWYNETDQRYMDPAEAFVAGKKYRVEAVLVLEQGYVLANRVTCTINDDAGLVDRDETVLGGDTWLVSVPFTASEKTMYNVYVNPSENGAVTADKAKAAQGERVTLTVKADDGYELDRLTVTRGREEVPVEGGSSFIMPDGDAVVNASFKKKAPASSGNDGGAPTAEPGSGSTGSTGSSGRIVSPKAGEQDDLTLWVLLLVASCGGVIVVLRERKRAFGRR